MNLRFAIKNKYKGTIEKPIKIVGFLCYVRDYSVEFKEVVAKGNIINSTIGFFAYCIVY